MTSKTYIIHDFLGETPHTPAGEYQRRTIGLVFVSDKLQPQLLRLFIATATCSANDQFSRKRGRQIVEGRLNIIMNECGDSPYVAELYTFEKIPALSILLKKSWQNIFRRKAITELLNGHINTAYIKKLLSHYLNTTKNFAPVV